MSKTKKPRKAYRPKAVFANPLLIAIQGVKLLSQDDQTLYALRLNDAVESVIKGEAKKQQWEQITDICNMLDVMSGNRQIMTNATEFVEEVQWVVAEILDRRKEGKCALYASEVQTLRELVSLWTEILSVVTHRQFFDTQEEVRRRVINAVRSNCPKLRIVEAA